MSFFLKQRNFLRRIDAKSVEDSENATPFHPLPAAEGRGEGEGGVFQSRPHKCACPFSIRKIISAFSRPSSYFTKLLNVTFCNSAYEALEGADGVVILTEWNEFRALDLAKVKAALKTPLMVDLRNIYRPAQMAAEGFRYVSIGRADAAPGEVRELPRRRQGER